MTVLTEKRKNSQIFFTLVELLVVISVLVILVALLLPALRSAMLSGKNIACVNNLKQIVTSCNMYPADNNDYLIPTATPSPTTKWFHVLQQTPYMGVAAKKALRCPLDETPVSDYLSYAYNDAFGYLNRNIPIKISKVLKPSVVPYLGDGKTNDNPEQCMAAWGSGMWDMGYSAAYMIIQFDAGWPAQWGLVRHNRSANVGAVAGNVRNYREPELMLKLSNEGSLGKPKWYRQ